MNKTLQKSLIELGIKSGHSKKEIIKRMVKIEKFMNKPMKEDAWFKVMKTKGAVNAPK